MSDEKQRDCLYARYHLLELLREEIQVAEKRSPLYKFTSLILAGTTCDKNGFLITRADEESVGYNNASPAHLRLKTSQVQVETVFVCLEGNTRQTSTCEGLYISK